MSNYTFATVAVAASDQAAAQASYPEYFHTGASETGEAPATHYVTSGPFDNVELAAILNSQDWPKRVAFGQDAQAGLAQLGLVLVSEPTSQQ
jgi:hypothetical protein